LAWREKVAVGRAEVMLLRAGVRGGDGGAQVVGVKPKLVERPDENRTRNKAPEHAPPQDFATALY